MHLKRHKRAVYVKKFKETKFHSRTCLLGEQRSIAPRVMY